MSKLLNFKRIFDAHADDNKKEWSHDRSKTVGASEIFQCLRKTFFTKHGYSQDEGVDESWGAIRRGDMIEAHYVVPALKNQLPSGAEILWAGDDQVTLIEGRLSATPDGLITGLPKDALKDYGVEDIEADSILVEIKSFDPRINLTEPKPVHVGQAQQQFGLVHSQTNHRPEYAVILYVNASWVDDIRPFVVKRDPAIFEAAKRRADIVFDATDPKQVTPEGKFKAGECDYCPFQKQCSMAQIGRLPDKTAKGTGLSAQQETALKDAIARYKTYQAQEANAEIEKKKVQEEIKQLLIQIGRRFAKTEDGQSVSWATVAGRKRYDIERLAEDSGLNLSDYEIEGEPTERLTVRGT